VGYHCRLPTRGIAPAVFVLAVLYTSVIILDRILRILWSQSCSLIWPSFCQSGIAIDWLQSRHCGRWVSVLLVLIVHMLTTILVNAFYVYALFTGLSGNSLLALQFGLSLFKILWNNVFIPFAMAHSGLTNNSRYLCSSFIMLFTFLVSPLVATFFSDTTCFGYIISPEPSVTSTFTTALFECDLACAVAPSSAVDCHEFCTYTGLYNAPVYTSVTAGWIYSFQCSSSLIMNNIPVLILPTPCQGL
jgi:hypothetical protein